METKAITETIGSYNVNKELVENIALCLQTEIRGLLSPELQDLDFSDKISITISLPNESKTNSSITEYLGQYPKLPFSDKTESITIELEHLILCTGYKKAIYFSITFSRERANNNLQISLTDESASAKISGIKDTVYWVLNHYKNDNNLIYRNEYLPTVYIIGGLLFAALTYISQSFLMRPSMGIVSGILLYFAAFRFVKGYCTFDTRSQKVWNSVFKWLTTAIAGAILAIILAMIRKQLFSR